jgi:hypothetical protein
VVECFWPGINEERLAAALTRIETAAGELHDAGTHIALRGSLLLPGDETVFCCFDGDDASIRAACRRAGIPVERVVESRWLAPAPSVVADERDP